MKTQSMTVGEFMSGKEWVKPKKKTVRNTLLVGASVGLMMTTVPDVMAMPVLSPVGHEELYMPAMGTTISGAVISKITTAFAPIMELLKGMSYPVVGILMTVACFLLMLGQKEKATSMMINATIGFFLIQLMPMFLNILGEVAKSL